MSDAPDSPQPPPPPPPPPRGTGAGNPPPPPPPRGPSDRSTAARTAIPPPPPPPATDAAPPTCPNCGAVTTKGQRVCVECGQDLTQAYERAPGWRLWVVAGVIGVLAVGVGAGFAIGALTNDKQKKKAAQATATTATIPNLAGPVPPLTNTEPPVTPTTTAPAPPTTPTAPAPGETPTGPTTPTTPTTPAKPAPTGGAPASWPGGKTAYTVVLISAKKKAQANAKAKEAKSRAINAGVLRSDDYSSLNPGYWVVFAGQYKTANEARSHIDEFAGKGFPGGYPRLVKK